MVFTIYNAMFFLQSIVDYICGIHVLGVLIVYNNEVGKIGNELSYTKAKGLVRYFVNMGYGKVVEQFVIPQLYNETKLEFVTIKVIFLKEFLNVKFCFVCNRFVVIKNILLS